MKPIWRCTPIPLLDGKGIFQCWSCRGKFHWRSGHNPEACFAGWPVELGGEG